MSIPGSSAVVHKMPLCVVLSLALLPALATGQTEGPEMKEMFLFDKPFVPVLMCLAVLLGVAILVFRMVLKKKDPLLPSNLPRDATETPATAVGVLGDVGAAAAGKTAVTEPSLPRPASAAAAIRAAPQSQSGSIEPFHVPMQVPQMQASNNNHNMLNAISNQTLPSRSQPHPQQPQHAPYQAKPDDHLQPLPSCFVPNDKKPAAPAHVPSREVLPPAPAKEDPAAAAGQPPRSASPVQPSPSRDTTTPLRTLSPVAPSATSSKTLSSPSKRRKTKRQVAVKQSKDNLEDAVEISGVNEMLEMNQMDDEYSTRQFKSKSNTSLRRPPPVSAETIAHATQPSGNSTTSVDMDVLPDSREFKSQEHVIDSQKTIGGHLPKTDLTQSKSSSK